jgi:hypothetical protein
MATEDNIFLFQTPSFKLSKSCLSKSREDTIFSEKFHAPITDMSKISPGVLAVLQSAFPENRTSLLEGTRHKPRPWGPRNT